MQSSMQQQEAGADGVVGELRSDAQKIGSKTADRFYNEVDARKGAAATQAKSVYNAIQSAADQLDDTAPTWVRSAFQQGAEQIKRFAETLDQKDTRQILHEVQSFARQRPGLFLGACAAAGFAASRVFKAGGEEQASQQFGSTEWDQTQPWGDGESDYGRSERFDRSFEKSGQSKPFIAAGDAAGQLSAGQQSSPSADQQPSHGAGGSGELPGRGGER